MEDYKYLFKVVLVGNAGVGKTCLVRKFTQGIFPPGQSATIGVDFMIKTVKVDDDKIKLQIWDTAGQERFRSITQSYYRSAHAIVLVYDVSSQPSFDCLPEWLAEIESYANRRVLKILVGNKVDKGDDREVPERVGRDFSEVNNFDYFLETSALNSTNVDQLFESVATRLTKDMKASDQKYKAYKASQPSNQSINLLDRAQQQTSKSLWSGVSTMRYSPIRTFIRMSSVGRASLFAHAKTGGFAQPAPVLRNPYRDDPLLDRILKRLLPRADYDKVSHDLSKFGDRIVSEIDELGRQAELNQPRLEPYDAWGNRVDNLIVCKEWNRLKEICAEEGLISIGYDEKVDGLTRRLHQVAKLYLFSPSAGLSTCPMAMTDGCVKTLKTLGLYDNHRFSTETVNRLVSRDGKKAWTSGQWMTEKKGGSDVAGGCDTYAVQEKENFYRLYGYKWFSSAIDADVALTLARVVDKQGNAAEGTRGLSLFLLRIKDDNGHLNGIQMIKLKNKLGTKQLPTAELLLDGAQAEIVSDPGRGVAGIANMLNITRIHNSIASVAGMRRIISLARDYSTRRTVFGRLQADWPLHTATLAKMEVETRGCFLLIFESARLLGMTESKQGTSEDSALLRLVTPIVKLYAGKQCVPLISEGIECFGGQGYIEDTGLPSILRDAQVTPIWEGTTNVLSLDVLRAFSGKEDVISLFYKRINELLANAGKVSELKDVIAKVENGLKQLQSQLGKATQAAKSGSGVHVDAEKQ
ncbi:hypothetical protein WR25_00019 [Diploscapter pachys]|uniref:Ras-related protein Rab-30 n=1 Tax=Diploscapter pachys TaxID=2018661 RepID=A0A2A2KEA9_9BILA|nr:hypothetical protein WR25_00019 [Diploscapter pachys]